MGRDYYIREALPMRLMNQWENQISHPYSQTLTLKISKTKSTHSSDDPKYLPRIKFGLKL